MSAVAWMLVMVVAGSSPQEAASGEAPAQRAEAAAESAAVATEGLAAVRAFLETGAHAEAETQARALLARVEPEQGADSLAAADVVDALVEALLRVGKAADPETRRLAERSVAIREKALGPEHRGVATSVNNLAFVLQALRDHAGARPHFERALAIREKVLGPEHPATATSLGNLASLLKTMGDNAGARPLFERALAINERALGPEHPDVATSLNKLALLLQGVGDHAGARALYERALAIREKALDPGHPVLAVSLINLAGLLHDLGDHAGARPLYERALAIEEKAHGPEHPSVATSLNNLAGLLQDVGDHAGARPLYERSLSIREKALGPDHPEVAIVLNNLAGLLQDMGNHSAARPLYERSLAIRTKVLGPDHPSVATGLNNLAALLQTLGDRAGARPLYERSLAIREKTLGPEHPNVATSLSNLASLLQVMGDHAGARPLAERALSIQEKALGAEHPAVAVSLNNVATLLRAMGDGAGARPLYERALAINEKALGPEHPGVATSLNNLTDLRRVMGDHAGARALLERALAINEKALGAQHPAVATTLNNLALLLTAMGDHEGARPFQERSIAVSEEALGPEHPDVAKSLNNLAWIHLATGETALALDASLRAERLGRDHARLTFRALSEREALEISSVRATGLDVALSAVASGLTPADRARAWDSAVRSRALVLDEIGTRRRSASGSASAAPEAQALAAASRRLAELTVRGPGKDAPERYRRLVADLGKEKEQAERALAERSVSFREEQARSRLGLAEVASSLAPGDALVAYSRYARHEITPRATPSAGEPRPAPAPVLSYLAFVLRGGEDEPMAVALGPRSDIDALVARWRDEVSRPGGSRDVGEELRAKTWDPVAAVLGDARRVLVVPDGALNLVSFAALPVGARQYLAETGPTLHYLSAERDLVPSALTTQRGEGLLALGGPAFDETALFAKLAPAVDAVPRLVATIAWLAPGSFRGEHSACDDFAELRFSPLSGAARESSEVASLWKRRGGDARPAAEVLHLSGASASEASLKAGAAGRRVLHLATHGFFLGGGCKSVLEGTRGVELASGLGEAPQPHAGENPLLLSGLALAGANHRDAAGVDEEDGILTAEEIASLELSGVEWAVLSACDTGLGDVQAGEGVFGLRRAFQVAGAGTVIMSLWSVDDEATRQWMSELYRARLERRLGTAECVREASLSVLRSRREKGESTHPFYWAGFVAAGDWR